MSLIKVIHLKVGCPSTPPPGKAKPFQMPQAVQRVAPCRASFCCLCAHKQLGANGQYNNNIITHIYRTIRCMKQNVSFEKNNELFNEVCLRLKPCINV